MGALQIRILSLRRYTRPHMAATDNRAIPISEKIEMNVFHEREDVNRRSKLSGTFKY